MMFTCSTGSHNITTLLKILFPRARIEVEPDVKVDEVDLEDAVNLFNKCQQLLQEIASQVDRVVIKGEKWVSVERSSRRDSFTFAWDEAQEVCYRTPLPENLKIGFSLTAQRPKLGEVLQHLENIFLRYFPEEERRITRSAFQILRSIDAKISGDVSIAGMIGSPSGIDLFFLPTLEGAVLVTSPRQVPTLTENFNVRHVLLSALKHELPLLKQSRIAEIVRAVAGALPIEEVGEGVLIGNIFGINLPTSIVNITYIYPEAGLAITIDDLYKRIILRLADNLVGQTDLINSVVKADQFKVELPDNYSLEVLLMLNQEGHMNKVKKILHPILSRLRARRQ